MFVLCSSGVCWVTTRRPVCSMLQNNFFCFAEQSRISPLRCYDQKRKTLEDVATRIWCRTTERLVPQVRLTNHQQWLVELDPSLWRDERMPREHSAQMKTSSVYIILYVRTNHTYFRWVAQIHIRKDIKAPHHFRAPLNHLFFQMRSTFWSKREGLLANILVDRHYPRVLVNKKCLLGAQNQCVAFISFLCMVFGPAFTA